MIKNQNTTILHTFICLKALQQYHTYNKYILNSFQYKVSTINLEDIIHINRFNCIDILSIINYILHISYTYDVIEVILKYQSTATIKPNKKTHKIYYQYLKKFIYTYQQYYNNNFQQKIHKDSTHNIAIMHIYILYKILHTKHKFIVYKYLYKDNI